MSENKNFLPTLLLIALTLMWGSSFILIKRGLETFGPAEVGALRITAAGIALMPLALPRIKRLHRRHWKLLTIVGIIGSLIPAFLFAAAQTSLDSSIAGILNALTPFFVMIVGALFFRQSFGWRLGLGLVVGFVGSAMLMFRGGSEGFSGINFHAFYIILAAICYGFNLNLIKFRIADISAVTITSISLLMVFPVGVIYLFTGTDFMSIMQNEPKALESLGYVVLLGVMSTGFALTLYNKLVQITNPIFTSSVTYLIPIVAVGWGLVDGEKLNYIHYIGMVLIISGIYLVNYVRRSKPTRPV